MSEVYRKISTHRHLLWIALAALVAFIGSLSLFTGDRLFLSPDENANQFFAETYARTGYLSAHEPLGASLDDSLHPRSIVSRMGELLPVSFLGLPATYGVIAAVFGSGVLPLVTPLLFVLSIFAFRSVVEKLTDRETADVSAILYAFHPSLWYYAARSMMHNVPFTVFLVFAVYFLLCTPLTHFAAKRRFAPTADLMISGFFVGFALFFRASEALWLIPAGAIAFLISRARVTPSHIIVFALGGIIGLIPLLTLNNATYGSPWSFGYTVEGSLVTDAAAAVPSTPAADASVSAFPFGLHPRAALRHLTEYGFGLFWWMTILALIGLPLIARVKVLAPERRGLRKAYLAFFVVAAGYLALMYGSWSIQDNPDPDAVTIGNSYVRYWLPAYVLSIPFAAAGLLWVTRRTLTPFARKMSMVALLVACIMLSARVVFLTPGDGFLPARRTLFESADIRRQVLILTEQDSVIIVDRADKLLFPARSVVTPLRDEHTYQLMPRIVRRAPLYYYGVTFPERDMEYLNGEKLKALGLHIEELRNFGIETLYQIRRTGP